MNKNPMDILKELDGEMFGNVGVGRKLAFSEGALSAKDKLLIGMALDASEGSVEGVRSLAEQAMKAGATKEEIMDALRVVYYITGVGSIYTAMRGLQEIL